MTEPTDDEIGSAVDKFVEAARLKAKEEIPDNGSRLTFEGDVVGGLGPTRQEIDDRIDAGVEQVRKRFEAVLTPHPDDFDTLIDPMQRVEANLGAYTPTADVDENTEVIGGGGDLSLLDTAKSDMSDWSGQLKNDLVDNYLTPFTPAITSTQGGLARFLRQQAQLMKAIYTRRRADAKKLAEQATVAVEAVNDSKGSDLSVGLAAVIAVSALIGGGGVLASGGYAVAMALGSAAVGAGATVGAEFVEDDKEVPLGADTVQGVVDNLYGALDESDKTMREEEGKVLEALQTIAGLVNPQVFGDDVDAGTELVPMRPDVTAVTNPDDLRDGFTVYGG